MIVLVGDADPSRERTVSVRRARGRDWAWLTRAGLSPEKAGVQYHLVELPLQLFVAPARGTPIRPGPRCIIEVDGRRAGYIGRNPLSGNLEYFLERWARGGGTGSRAIAAFLRDHRRGDRDRAFFVSRKNPRSRAALDRAFAELGWREDEDVTTRHARLGQRITVRAENRQVPTERGRGADVVDENGA